jgi:hypothetical protein
MTYLQHPLSAAFPSMSQDEIQALANDISANGQREPGIIFEDMVLDGWHRYQACEIAGVEFDSRPLPKYDDPVLFVKSRNLHRRHLTASQRAAAVVACNEWYPGGANKTGTGSAADPVKKATNAEMAKEADVSVTTIKSAKVATGAGMNSDMRDGKISAEKAADKAKGKTTPPPKQLYTKPEQSESAHDDADMAQLAGELQSENEAYQRKITSLEKDDLAAEIIRLNTYIDQLGGRIFGLTNEKNDATKMAQRHSDLLGKIRKALGVDKNSEILGALKKK